MSFVMPELVLESVIKDGLASVKLDPTIINDVFGNLTRSYAAKKYGETELDKIKNFVTGKDLRVVHSYHMVMANIPCISIQLADDRETIRNARMGDFEQMTVIPIEDEVALAALTIVDNFTPLTYDPLTGIVTVSDAVSMSNVYINSLFVDALGNEFVVQGGIDDTPGSKKFLIAKNQTVDLNSGAIIKSSLDFDQYVENGNMEDTQLIVGVHTKDPLLTKYLYILLKYFFLSRKCDIAKRGIQLSTYSGSDFSRNMDYKADAVFTRFLQFNGQLINSWRADKVIPIDQLNLNVVINDDE